MLKESSAVGGTMDWKRMVWISPRDAMMVDGRSACSAGQLF